MNKNITGRVVPHTINQLTFINYFNNISVYKWFFKEKINKKNKNKKGNQSMNFFSWGNQNTQIK